MSRPPAYLLAGNLRLAHAAAERCGWESLGGSWYRTPEGVPVQALPNRRDAMDGRSLGSTLYLAPGWRRRRDRAVFDTELYERLSI